MKEETKNNVNTGFMLWFRFIYFFLGMIGLLGAITNFGKVPMLNILGGLGISGLMFFILFSDYKWHWFEKIVYDKIIHS